ncbi:MULTISPECIES: acrylyl-CoA reductase (NADPH) [Acetobacter]|jgi:acrylyl-CoA reductase (NADPH)|uniref:Acrylyl-CoA reductase (NADPH) n=1 Tax=Acetobacter lovaniensis TaxID=104100 RepID=A0A841QGA9_9PROT|nr:MDR family oxidoreductase [Acetobacter lovaniensis]MBB6457395.1 acrylyl-CoA reductase (NADPH) [Acetobacter lovaniensis]MCI1698341.1 oxidoreductase [Acetobacter lovaniensis]MCI1796430.1 oxidoreductase [Acetobacter lovaniensis]MCP1239785.1 oxidoreductase [Acetobacter lovaniensis]NHN81551.1 acryloyl-CoA reductase [Acetobacter lovaniensis]
MFDALYLEQAGQTATLRKLPENALPDEEVTVRVHWSGLNYKDALAITGRGPVVRAWPMVPGIDFAGVVERSSSPDFTVGQQVMLNGWGVGEKHWGGLAQKASVPGAWLLPLPQGLDARQVLALGTAGFTAMLCVQALVREGVEPASGPVLVTGATGGVGSVAVMLLARLGYEVVAVTGRLEEQPYLQRLGASEVLARSHFEMPSRPLEKARWAGAVDVVGGQVLASVCASMKPQGVVTACGLAGGMAFPATVAPFILRGVTLVGIDSVMCPKEVRQDMWDRLALLVNRDLLAEMTRVIPLSGAVAAATDLLDGKIKGRVVVEVP